MNPPKVVIIGFGVLGQAMHRLFPSADLIDPPKNHPWIDTSDHDLAIVCVPTPSLPNGRCDISAVEEAVAKCNAANILVKSTVEPGTCSRLDTSHGKFVVFSPEYIGESKYYTPPQFPDPHDARSHGFMILGGNSTACSDIADIFLPVLGPTCRFRFMTATEAELVKYAENAFFAMKVTFANELRRICENAWANYHVVREGWLDDSRVGPMHSAAFKQEPGFGGKCLPKDLLALERYAAAIGVPSALLAGVLYANDELQR
jgi:UDPglucose 6-dehydrogenase